MHEKQIFSTQLKYIVHKPNQDKLPYYGNVLIRLSWSRQPNETTTPTSNCPLDSTLGHSWTRSSCCSANFRTGTLLDKVTTSSESSTESAPSPLQQDTDTHTHFNTANAFFRRGSKSWLKTWTFSPSCMKPFQRLYCEIVTSEEQYSPRRIWDTAGLYDTGHDWSLPVLSLTLTSTWCKLPFNASPTKSADKIRSIVDYFHTDLIPHP